MLTFQFIPYAEISNLSSEQRIDKLIDIVMDNKIVLLEGRLTKEEEADLIATTMDAIDEHFKGIELSVVYPEPKNQKFIESVKSSIAKILIGNRLGFTVIGPASIIKEIKNDPDKIHMFVEGTTTSVKRKRK